MMFSGNADVILMVLVVVSCAVGLMFLGTYCLNRVTDPDAGE
jgi:hypothetical protein